MRKKTYVYADRIRCGTTDIGREMLIYEQSLTRKRVYGNIITCNNRDLNLRWGVGFYRRRNPQHHCPVPRRSSLVVGECRCSHFLLHAEIQSRTSESNKLSSSRRHAINMCSRELKLSVHVRNGSDLIRCDFQFPLIIWGGIKTGGLLCF